jgi:hypothetical protein
MSRKFDLALEVERWRDIDKVDSMSLFAEEYVDCMSPTKAEIKFLENYFEDRDDEDYRIVMFIKEEMEGRGLV